MAGPGSGHGDDPTETKKDNPTHSLAEKAGITAGTCIGLVGLTKLLTYFHQLILSIDLSRV